MEWWFLINLFFAGFSFGIAVTSTETSGFVINLAASALNMFLFATFYRP